MVTVLSRRRRLYEYVGRKASYCRCVSDSAATRSKLDLVRSANHRDDGSDSLNVEAICGRPLFMESAQATAPSGAFVDCSKVRKFCPKM